MENTMLTKEIKKYDNSFEKLHEYVVRKNTHDA